jgi:ribosomal protein L37AE/L43A/predicted GIY-YIG superfamily endonuclease
MAEQTRLWYLYELIDQYGTVCWVGVTYRPEYRFNQHTRVRPNPNKKTGYGTFYGRTDLQMNIVNIYTVRKEALADEILLKLEYGLEVGELAGLKAVDKREAGRRGAAVQVASGRVAEMGKASMAKIHTCPHCGKKIKGAVYGTWHGDNCKLNPLKHA